MIWPRRRRAWARRTGPGRGSRPGAATIRLLRDDAGGADGPADRRAAVARGERLYRDGAYAEAAGVLAPLVRAQPHDVAALRLLGLCWVRLGKADGLELLRCAHVLAPADTTAALQYGFGLYAAHRHAEAAKLFAGVERAMGVDPAPPLNLAACLYAIGDYPAAVAAARRARLRAPRLAQARYMLGLTRMALGRLAAAEAAFLGALERDEGMVEAWINLGLLRHRRGDAEGARQAMMTVLKIDPEHSLAAANLAVLNQTADSPSL